MFDSKEKIIKIGIVIIVLAALAILFASLSGSKKRMGNAVLSGVIDGKAESALVVDAVSLRGVVGSGNKVLRTIYVDEKTVIKKQLKKTPDVYQKEQAEYDAALIKGDRSVKPPTPFSEVTISFKELNAGDYISTEVDSNIEKNDSAVAKIITLNAKETTPSVAIKSDVAARVVGSVGWKGTNEDSRFAVDRGDGTRVQIYITNETQFIKQEKKDEKEFSEEMKMFKAYGGAAAIPSPLKETPALYTNMGLGAQVEVQGMGSDVNGVSARRVIILVPPEPIN